MDLSATFIPIAALAINAVAQLLFCRAGAGLLRSIKAGFAFGLAGLALLHEYSPQGTDVLAANTLIYITLSYCYFHFLNLGETARRIRLLRELRSNPDGMTAADMLTAYNAKSIVEARLGRLLRSGQVEKGADGRLRIKNAHLLASAKLLRLLKKLFLGKTNADIPQ